jgi:hypothetical protein
LIDHASDKLRVRQGSANRPWPYLPFRLNEASYDQKITTTAIFLNDEGIYETVVIDSLDWLERMIWDRVCQESGVKSIKKADGGFAKGYTHALTFWREIVDQLNALRAGRGMVVLLIAHAKVEKFEDPEWSPYDRYSPRLHKHAAALVSEWYDAVLFATRKIRTQTEELTCPKCGHVWSATRTGEGVDGPLPEADLEKFAAGQSACLQIVIPERAARCAMPARGCWMSLSKANAATRARSDGVGEWSRTVSTDGLLLMARGKGDSRGRSWPGFELPQRTQGRGQRPAGSFLLLEGDDELRGPVEGVAQ